MHRGFRFRLYPTPAQAETLGQWVGVTRLVYNLAFEQRRDFWRQFRACEGRSIGLASQGRELTALRAVYDWIAAVPQSALEAALNDLDKAFAAFFGGAGFPTPRRLGQNDSVRFRGRDTGVRRLNRHWGEVRVPKLGWMRFRMSRPIQGSVQTMTIRRDAGRWHVTFACEVGAAPGSNPKPAIGIDRGVVNAISLSNGEHVRLPDLSALEKRRRRAQRVLARRKRGSRRYALQRKSLTRLAGKIGRVRSHALHG
ncbi:MAG: transposase, partial [Alphaproteobacteria bacterium]